MIAAHQRSTSKCCEKLPMNRIGIGILFFNEIDNAKKIYDDIVKHNLLNIDFYFLDNGSNNPDFTNWLQTIEGKNIKILQIDKNLGFGGGAKYILRNVPNKFRGYMPGNYKVKPESLRDIESFFGSAEKIDVFKATRAGRNFIDRAKTFAVGFTTSVYFGSNMLDSGGTPTIIKEELIESFQNGPNDFSFEAYLLYTSRKLKLRLKRVPIKYGVRIYGQSHWQSGIKSELNLLLCIIKQKKVWKSMI